MPRTSRMLPLVGASFALLVSAGCSSAADKASEKLVERAIESESGGDVDLNFDADGEGTFSVETEDGSFSMGAGGEVPDAWPSDVPLPDDLEVISGSTMSDGSSGEIVSVSGSTGASVDEVIASFEGLAGWTVDNESTMSSTDGSISSLFMSQGDRNLSITVSEGSDGVTVTLSHVVDAAS